MKKKPQKGTSQPVVLGGRVSGEEEVGSAQSHEDLNSQAAETSPAHGPASSAHLPADPP